MRQLHRVMVVGCVGAGKTTLSHQIAERLDLPLFHLDEIMYDREWNKTSPAEFSEAHAALIAGEHWILDGYYRSTMPERLERAELVVWLDLPTHRSLWHVFKRHLHFGPGQHEGGVFSRIRWSLLRYIIGYRRTRAPELRRLLSTQADNLVVVVLRNRREITAFQGALSQTVDSDDLLSRVSPLNHARP